MPHRRRYNPYDPPDGPESGSLDYALWAAAAAARPTGVVTDDMLRDWITGPVFTFFPHRRFMCGYLEFNGGALTIRKRISTGYAPEQLAVLDPAFDPTETNCFTHWIRERKPVHFDPDHPPAFASKKEVRLARSLKLGHLAFHGVADFAVGTGSHTVFSGLPGWVLPHITEAMNLIAPVVHAIILDTLAQPDGWLKGATLTARQIEIANLVGDGLTNRQIAEKLDITLSTVNNHVNHIFRALGVQRRSQLLALLKSRSTL